MDYAKKNLNLENKILQYFFKIGYTIDEKGDKKIRKNFNYLGKNTRLRSITDTKYKDLYFKYF